MPEHSSRSPIRSCSPGLDRMTPAPELQQPRLLDLFALIRLPIIQSVSSGPATLAPPPSAFQHRWSYVEPGGFRDSALPIQSRPSRLGPCCPSGSSPPVARRTPETNVALASSNSNSAGQAAQPILDPGATGRPAIHRLVGWMDSQRQSLGHRRHLR